MPTVAVGGSCDERDLPDTSTDYWLGVRARWWSGTSYQIDLRSDGHPSIDPWIVDIWDDSNGIIQDHATPRVGHHLLRGGLTTATSTTTPAPATRRGSSTPRPTRPKPRERKPLHRGRQPRRMVSEAGRLAPDSDRGVCPVLRRLRGGRFHHGGHRVCGRLCVGPRLIRLRAWYNAGDTGGPDGYYSHEPGWTDSYSGYSCHRETGDGIELDGDTCDRDWFRSRRSPEIGPTSCNWRAGRIC